MTKKYMYDRWVKFRKWPWFWCVPQIILFMGYFTTRWIIGYKSNWIWLLTLSQWILLYFQLRSYKWKGTELVLWEDTHEPWELLYSDRFSPVILIYKKQSRADGYTSYWVIPFHNRWRIMNWIKRLGVVFLYRIKLLY